MEPRKIRGEGKRRPPVGQAENRHFSSRQNPVGGKARPQPLPKDYIEGLHPVAEFMDANPSGLMFVAFDSEGGRDVRELAERARKAGVETRSLTRSALVKLVGREPHQGVVSMMRPFAYADLEKVLDDCGDDPAAVLVALDSVQDPHNLGSILRTCAFFGVRGVIIPKDRSVSVTPAVIRTSAGGAARVPVCQVVNLARTLALCNDRGWETVGTVVSGGVGLHEIPRDRPVVLVMGAEGDGLRRLVRETCSNLVTIPSVAGFDSLNVGVAAGIVVSVAVLDRLSSGGLR